MTDVHYTVRGSWPFPLDMLRRDQSTAATPEDLALIESLSQEFAPDRGSIKTPVEINLVILDNPRGQPLTARWESFGWSVPSDIDHSRRQADQRRQAKFSKLLKSVLSKLTQDEVEALEWYGLARPE